VCGVSAGRPGRVHEVFGDMNLVLVVFIVFVLQLMNIGESQCCDTRLILCGQVSVVCCAAMKPKCTC
jgi:hypothetical protein